MITLPTQSTMGPGHGKLRRFNEHKHVMLVTDGFSRLALWRARRMFEEARAAHLCFQVERGWAVVAGVLPAAQAYYLRLRLHGIGVESYAEPWDSTKRRPRGKKAR